MQLNTTDLSKDEVEIEMAKVKAGTLLFSHTCESVLNGESLTPPVFKTGRCSSLSSTGQSILARDSPIALSLRHTCFDKRLDRSNFSLVEEERKCIDPHGRLLFRKPKEKSDEPGDTGAATTSKSDIIEMASNKPSKRKAAAAASRTSSERVESDRLWREDRD